MWLKRLVHTNSSLLKLCNIQCQQRSSIIRAFGIIVTNTS